jgi:hypothetical protein
LFLVHGHVGLLLDGVDGQLAPLARGAHGVRVGARRLIRVPPCTVFEQHVFDSEFGLAADKLAVLWRSAVEPMPSPP